VRTWEARGTLTPNEVRIVQLLAAWQREHEEQAAHLAFLQAVVDDLRLTVEILTQLS
jgi:hypothetical protein